MHAKKRKIPRLLIAFFILIGITLLLVAAALGLWLHGRSALTGQVSAPVLPPVTASSDESGEDAPPPAGTDDLLLDSYTIQYKGKYYRYKENLCNILLIGVDSQGKPAQSGSFGGNYQADVLVLVVLDPDAGKMSLLSVSRDTICDIEVLDESGESLGLAQAQLALSYAYGDGLKKSCELTRDAVSNLFYGLQIHGYGALYMDGVADLNDAVGGVTVTVLDDYPFTDIAACWNMRAGEQVTLTGQQAAYYIRARLHTTEGNNLRMQRQKQYMLSLVSAAKDLILSNPTKVFSVYNAVSDYIVTDLSIDRIAYLATLGAGLSFSGDITKVQGESVLGGDETHAEFYVDKDALYDLMIQVFYEEVRPEA